MKGVEADGDSGLRGFYLAALRGASREFSILADIVPVLDCFLLTSMGALGASQGFCLLAALGGAPPVLTARGLSQPEEDQLRQGMSQARSRYFPEHAGSLDAFSQGPRFVVTAGDGGSPVLPAGTAMAVRFVLQDGTGVLLGLGLGRSGEKPDHPQQEFLLNLAGYASIALDRTLATARIENLNTRMAEQTRQLDESLSKSSTARAELDRRLFELHALNDVIAELSGHNDPRELAKRFLLLVMGDAGAASGFLLLHQAKGEAPIVEVRGDPGLALGTLNEKMLRQIIAKQIFASNEPGATPPLTGLATLGEAGDEACAKAPLIWFVLDENRFGAIGLPCRSIDDFVPGEAEFLITLTGYFLAYLQSAALAAKTRRLGDELAKSDSLLKKSRGEAARIRAVVSRELARTGLVSWLDFVIFLGLAAAVGLLYNYATPTGVAVAPQAWFRPAPQTIDAGQAAALYASGKAVFVDARPREVFEQRHVAGAVNVPPGFFSFVYGMKLSKTPADAPIVVYGRTVSRLYDDDLAFELARKGRSTTVVFPGGLSAWERLAQPVAGKAAGK